MKPETPAPVKEPVAETTQEALGVSTDALNRSAVKDIPTEVVTGSLPAAAADASNHDAVNGAPAVVTQSLPAATADALNRSAVHRALPEVVTQSLPAVAVDADAGSAATWAVEGEGPAAEHDSEIDDDVVLTAGVLAIVCREREVRHDGLEGCVGANVGAPAAPMRARPFVTAAFPSNSAWMRVSLSLPTFPLHRSSEGTSVALTLKARR